MNKISEYPSQYGYKCAGCGNVFLNAPDGGFERDDGSIEYYCSGCMDQKIIDMKVRPF